MKKSLSAILVIILSMVGAKAFAAKVDVNVKRAVQETNDSTGDKNEGTRRCGSKAGNSF